MAVAQTLTKEKHGAIDSSGSAIDLALCFNRRFVGQIAEEGISGFICYSVTGEPPQAISSSSHIIVLLGFRVEVYDLIPPATVISAMS